MFRGGGVYQLVPMTKLFSAECWGFEGDRFRKKIKCMPSKGNVCHLYNHINSALAERASAAVI